METGTEAEIPSELEVLVEEVKDFDSNIEDMMTWYFNGIMNKINMGTAKAEEVGVCYTMLAGERARKDAQIADINQKEQNPINRYDLNAFPDYDSTNPTGSFSIPVNPNDKIL